MNRLRYLALPAVCLATSAIALAGNGLRGQYFNNNGLLGTPTLARTDATVNFDWGSASPATGLSGDRFSARWTGKVQAGVAGPYKFATISDSGIRLWVNNALVIDSWTSHSTRTDRSNTINFAANEQADIKIDFYENTGNATAKLLWTPPGAAEVVVPQSALTSDPVPANSVFRPYYLSDLTPTAQQNGWGPYQRDRSNGELGGSDGAILGIGGVKFSKGLGVHANSELRYNLAARYEKFSVFIGVDDEVGNQGGVVFQVWLDGVKVFESAKLRGSDAPKPVELTVAGKNELKLIVLDGGDGNNYDHADWADAHLLDTSTPAAPYSLTATAGEGKVSLNWPNVFGAVSYNVYRGTSPNVNPPVMVASNIPVSEYVNTGLSNGTTYYFRVAAVNLMGVGALSTEASATPAGAVAAPPAPQNVSATSGDKSVKLTWSAVAGAMAYNIYRGTSSGGQASSPVAGNINSTSFTDQNLTNGVKYFYRIAALGTGGTGPKSSEVSATPTGAPPPPTPTGLTAAPGNQQVVLSWAAVSGAINYSLYRGTSSGGQGSTPMMTAISGTSFTDKPLTNGTMYFYKVAAVNANGTSDKSTEASAKPAAPPGPPAPTGLSATAGDAQIVLTWSASNGAEGYSLYRGTSAGGENATPIASNLTSMSYTDKPLTNGTKYYYKVAGVNNNGAGEKSTEASATPAPPPGPPAPAGLTATAGNAQVVLNWTASEGAISYSVYRGTSSGGQATTAVATGVTTTTYTDPNLTNGTKYYYKVAGVNANATGNKSNEASATPQLPAKPPTPAGLSAVGGNQQITLTWTASTGATSYNLYRATTSGGQGTTPITTNIAGTTATDPNLVNGTTYYYKVAAVNAGGTSNQSSQVSTSPAAPALLLSAAQKDAFQFLRQSTWGPTMPLVDHVVQVGKGAFIDEQMAAPQSMYPDELITLPNMDLVSERFFQNGLQGEDQLRQRVAWALSQIFVVSAVKVDNTHAMVPYIRMLHTRAFDNVKDIMRDMALSPAMGEFLDMVNNKKTTNGQLPNENFAREWMQLFSLGLTELNDDGSTGSGPNGTATYTQSDILEMARVLTGWTYGDQVAGDPNETRQPFYDGPMEPVAKYHDTGAKTVLGQPFAQGQSARADFDQALNVVFGHHNVGPFLCKELIQRLVTSNPSPTYISACTEAFNNNGQGVRGDMKAVVKAILLNPESVNGTLTSGKFAEPALFLLNVTRALNAQVVDHPFMSDFSESMAQRIWFAPSVFNYFSPGFRSNGLLAPEMQIWTTATAMTRTNFLASLLSNGFGADVTLNLTPFTNSAGNPQALVDTVDAYITGNTMPPEVKTAIITALGSSSSTTEKVRTALYLAAASMQYQVEH